MARQLAAVVLNNAREGTRSVGYADGHGNRARDAPPWKVPSPVRVSMETAASPPSNVVLAAMFNEA